MKRVEEMNYYELLNVEVTASKDEIQKAYNLACQTYQEDSLATYSVVSETERMQILQRIEKAYRILMDDRERAKYDYRIGLADQRRIQEKQPAMMVAQSEEMKGRYSTSSRSLNLSANNDKAEEAKSSEPPPDISDPHYLKKLRERKGVSLQEISEATMISVHALTDLENGEYSKFPGRVYIVGFLRAYAEYLGIDFQQAKAHFEILYGASNKQKK
ncbi:MAG: helix-turn-helix domain-containing protein [bacterium]|nr:helix-turn-helix domain-containing protein [bacterium]